MLLHAITNRARYDGIPAYRLDCVVREAALWSAEGVDYIQLREKDLAPGEQVALVRRVIAAVREVGGEGATRTRVLVNSRLDVAIAAGADGVHLTGATGELTPAQVREAFSRVGSGAPVVSVSCHSVDEAARAAGWEVDGILFGPVFGKEVDGAEVVPGVGLDQLRKACLAAPGTPVFALGGVTMARAGECMEAGAAGVAGIRLFLRNSPEQV